MQRIYSLTATLLVISLCTASSVLSASESIVDMDLRSLLKVKIKSVSKIEEPASEAVVPITLISEQMIRNTGARTLKDLLVTFVPGMTFVQDQNEVNVAMRGVYSSSQQKILILLEGHRLNSRLISAANPDQSIGLDKIKRIEVIRGPGSAAYGNVALTAVINIVLKKGAELDGAEVAVAAGNFGQSKLSANWGKPLAGNGDLFSWLHYYQNDGERISISPENDYARSPASDAVEAIVGGYFDKPAYDVGLKLSRNDWEFLLNSRRAHYVEPFTSASLTGEAFDYSDYPKRNGIGPGFQYTFWHFSVGHSRALSADLKWENRLYYDSSDMESTFVLDPAVQSFGQGNMYDRSAGFTSDLTWTRPWGSALIGMQYDAMEVYKSSFPIGVNGEYSGNLFTDENPLVRPGRESVLSYYATWKYYLNDRWLTNIGFRYDDKNRLTMSNEHNFSPRIGLIYFGEDDFQMKMSFSESFVDSPYWNRYGALPAFRGSEFLEPENLRSIQLTPRWQFNEGTTSYEVNVFHNELTNFVFRNNQAGPNEPINTNAGLLKSWGNEHQLTYSYKQFQLRMVAFFNKVKEVEGFAASNAEIYNIPNRTMNLILDYQWSNHLRANLQFNHIGERLSPININLDGAPIADPFPNSGVDYQVPDNRLPAKTLTNLNFIMEDLLLDNSSLEFHIYNLFDLGYRQGGTTLFPYPQEGRWMMLQYRQRF